MSSKPCLTITFLRHAETNAAAVHPRILQGQNDTELNIDGTKQALSVAQRLRKETFHYIYSSDLKTCVQTTEEIKKKHPDTPVIYDKRLREQNIGDLTGLPWKEAKNILKKNDLNLNSFIANNNGEEISKFIARINEWYADIIFKHLIIPQQEYFDEIDDNTSGLKSKTISAACSPIGTPLSSSRSSSMSSLNSDDSTFGTHLKTKGHIHILIITHGGWIQQYLKYLITDLKFALDPLNFKNDNTQDFKPNLSFPRHTGLYKATIFRKRQDSKLDKTYEWKGVVQLMNEVSHLSNLDNKIISDGNLKSDPNSKINSQRNSTNNLGKGNSGSKYKNDIDRTIAILKSASLEDGDGTVVKKKRSLGW